MTSLQCSRCGATNVAVSLQNDPFQYSVGEDAPWLDATVPVYHCHTCDFQFTLSEADAIKSLVVANYLFKQLLNQ